MTATRRRGASGAVGLWCCITYEGALKEPGDGYAPSDVEHYGEVVSVDETSVWVELYSWIVIGDGDGEVRPFRKPEPDWAGWRLYRTKKECFNAASEAFNRDQRRLQQPSPLVLRRPG